MPKFVKNNNLDEAFAQFNKVHVLERIIYRRADKLRSREIV